MTTRKSKTKPLTRAKKPTREPERAVVVLRSEGQRLLNEAECSLGDIAMACGVSRQAAQDWRTGRKAPGPANRASLWNAYQIPAHAWGRLPGGGEAESRPIPEAMGIGLPPNGHGPNGNGHATPALEGAAAPSSLNQTAQLLSDIRAQLAERDLLPSDRVRITDSYTRTLALQHRLQREVDLTEDRIIREHPTWQRIKAELARVLVRHPAAADEVCAALERLNV